MDESHIGMAKDRSKADMFGTRPRMVLNFIININLYSDDYTNGFIT